MTRRPVVWITRPQPGADRTAAALAQAGYEPFVLPLTEIADEDPGIDPAEIADTDFVAVTSANAIRHAPIPLARALKATPLYAVGAATKMAALDRGFLKAFSADGAVDDLVRLISGREQPGAKGLYLAGRDRTGDLEGKLATLGLECRPIEVYKAEIVSYTTEYLRDAINRRAPDAVLFHSAQSALAYVRDVLADFPQLAEIASCFAISQRVADRLSGIHPERIRVADAPNEQALLAALQKTLPAVGH